MRRPYEKARTWDEAKLRLALGGGGLANFRNPDTEVDPI